MESPQTFYAKSGDVHVAYQLFGQGDIDLVLVPGWTSNLDIWWDCREAANWLHRMGSYARVLIFDKRGSGLSDRSEAAPGMDERMDDIRAVMDHAKIERAAVLGWSEGGTLAALFAASHPQRCRALVLQGAFARFQSWFATERDLQDFYDYAESGWGSGINYPKYSPSMTGDAEYQAWWARRERASASPGAAIKLMKLNSAIDASDILPSVNVPTLVVHRTNDRVVDVEGGRQLDSLIPNATMFEAEGQDHTPWTGVGLEEIAAKIQEFLTGTKPTYLADRVLATVLFTDIADSTVQAERFGDREWKRLLDEHDAVVERELKRFRGHKVKSLGDGILAIFDGPARAACAGLAIIEALDALGLKLRAGVHIGEVQKDAGDISGLAVHIAARVMGSAGPGECLVSRTVRDLSVGSEITYATRGAQDLKGLSESVELFVASR
jgi:pimeloyl-ACP methyl ester carboxylesterase